MPRRQRHWPARVERKVLPMVMRRDNYQCQIRGPNCTFIATCVDHIHPKAWGGGVHPSNLRAACKPCNLSKGARGDGSQPVQAAGGFFSTQHQRRAPLRNLPPQGSRWAVKPVQFGRKPVES